MQEIGHFQKNAREVVKATLGEYKGRKIVDIRAYYQDTDNNLKPTKKGLTISQEKIEDLANLVQKVVKVIKDSKKGE